MRNERAGPLKGVSMQATEKEKERKKEMYNWSDQPSRPLACTHKRAPNFNTPYALLYTLAILLDHKKRTFHAPVCNRLKTHTSHRKSASLAPQFALCVPHFPRLLSPSRSLYIVRQFSLRATRCTHVCTDHPPFPFPSSTFAHAIVDGMLHKNTNASRSWAWLTDTHEHSPSAIHDRLWKSEMREREREKEKKEKERESMQDDLQHRMCENRRSAFNGHPSARHHHWSRSELLWEECRKSQVAVWRIMNDYDERKSSLSECIFFYWDIYIKNFYISFLQNLVKRVAIMQVIFVIAQTS